MNLPEPEELYGDEPSTWLTDPSLREDPRAVDSEFDAVTPEDVSDGSIWAPLTQITSTMDPERPRTLMAGYDNKNFILTVQFRDHTVYNYYDVSPAEWEAFMAAYSKNDYIKAILEGKRHGKASMNAPQAAAYKGLGRNAARYKKTMYPGTQKPYGGRF